MTKSSVIEKQPLAVNENKEKQKIKLTYSSLFWLFMLGSVIGFVLEGLWCVVRKGHWENHSATVWGPFCIIYGLGAVAVYIMTAYFKDKNVFLQFALCAASGTLIEYVSSVFQEICFDSYSWNYSNHFLNLGGRVSLQMTLIWGILGILFMRFLFPPLAKFLERLKGKGWRIACICLSVFMCINLLVTSVALTRWKERTAGIEADSAIAEFVDDIWDDEKMEAIYPNMTFINTSEQSGQGGDLQ